MLTTIKTRILRLPFFRAVNQLRYVDFDPIYNTNHLDDSYYEKVKNLGDIELEHQIGRLTHYKKILSEIAQENLVGDVVEFGTWRGFSLIWIGILMQDMALFSKKIIGIDGFVGLPESEGEFSAGAFENTSKDFVSTMVKRSKYLYDVIKKNIHIEEALFSKKKYIIDTLRKYSKNGYVFIHIDCDLSSSAQEIFTILEEGKVMADTCYILFDDYGSVSNLHVTIEQFVERMRKGWHVTEHSHTNLTKNFKFVRKT